VQVTPGPAVSYGGVRGEFYETVKKWVAQKISYRTIGIADWRSSNARDYRMVNQVFPSFYSPYTTSQGMARFDYGCVCRHGIEQYYVIVNGIKFDTRNMSFFPRS
jgi:hypothetical protein